MIHRNLVMALAAATVILGGCLSNDADEALSQNPFPRPLGEAIIPLEQEAFSNFEYVEYDTAGDLVLRQNLTLQIIPKALDTYGYAFEDPRRGQLLTWKDGNGNRDSAGIYIVGSFRDSALTYDSAEILWLPQFPVPGVKRTLAPGWETELISSDTGFFTEVLFHGSAETAKAPVSHGFQKHPTLLFRETTGDTLTYYHFRRGVGCLGFERSAGGKLIAAGFIKTFYGRSRSSGGSFYE
ncbi:MAG: hypothetical protein M3Y08_04565 [Fibrobacterota bacterium]|nr:hypothetical protein [Fibrobacterota bacterium]